MQSAPTELERAKAEVLLGCYWARVGDISAAEQIRTSSRTRYPSGVYGELTILHMCLEGLMQYYSEQSPAAGDRLKSAHALATTYRFRSEQAFSAVWLAHVEFNRDRWEATFDALRSCLAALEPEDRATQGRLSLVVADSLNHSGEIPLSRIWYDHARTLFASIGDHAAIEAFLYNGAVLRLHSARLRSIAEPPTSEELVRLGGEIDSATNYQRITEQRSLDYLLAAATASLHILREDFPAAQRVLIELFGTGQIPKASTAPALMLADLALCAAKLEGREQVISALNAAETALPANLAPDDFAVCAHSLAAACNAIGHTDAAIHWAIQRDESLSRFRMSQDRLRALLAPWMKNPQEAIVMIN